MTAMVHRPTLPGDTASSPSPLSRPSTSLSNVDSSRGNSALPSAYGQNNSRRANNHHDDLALTSLGWLAPSRAQIRNATAHLVQPQLKLRMEKAEMDAIMVEMMDADVKEFSGVRHMMGKKHLMRAIDNLETVRGEVSSKLDTANQKVKWLEEESAALLAELAKINSKFDCKMRGTMTAKAYSEFSEMEEQLKREIDECHRLHLEHESKQSQVAGVQEQITELQKQIAEVKGAAAEVESQIADLKHHVDEHRQQYKNLTYDNAELQVIELKNRRFSEDLVRKIRNVQEQNVDLKEVSERLKSENSRLINQYTEIRRQNELLNQNLESVQRMQVESKEEVEGVASELTEWRAKKELFQRQCRHLSKEIRFLHQQRDDMARRLAIYETMLSRKEEAVAELTQRVKDIQLDYESKMDRKSAEIVMFKTAIRIETEKIRALQAAFIDPDKIISMDRYWIEKEMAMREKVKEMKMQRSMKEARIASLKRQLVYLKRSLAEPRMERVKSLESRMRDLFEECLTSFENLEIVKEPVTLVPCGHSFCRVCFDGRIAHARKDGRLVCPEDGHGLQIHGVVQALSLRPVANHVLSQQGTLRDLRQFFAQAFAAVPAHPSAPGSPVRRGGATLANAGDADADATGKTRRRVTFVTDADREAAATTATTDDAGRSSSPAEESDDSKSRTPSGLFAGGEGSADGGMDLDVDLDEEDLAEADLQAMEAMADELLHSDRGRWSDASSDTSSSSESAGPRTATMTGRARTRSEEKRQRDERERGIRMRNARLIQEMRMKQKRDERARKLKEREDKRAVAAILAENAERSERAKRAEQADARESERHPASGRETPAIPAADATDAADAAGDGGPSADDDDDDDDAPQAAPTEEGRAADGERDGEEEAFESESDGIPAMPEEDPDEVERLLESILSPDPDPTARPGEIISLLGTKYAKAKPLVSLLSSKPK